MRVDEEVRGQLAIRFEVLLPHLNERQQRLALACEAGLLGHGGVAAVAEAAGVSPTTVRRGVTELDSAVEPLPVGRARRSGGGRKPVTAHDPELMAALLDGERGGLLVQQRAGEPGPGVVQHGDRESTLASRSCRPVAASTPAVIAASMPPEQAPIRCVASTPQISSTASSASWIAKT